MRVLIFNWKDQAHPLAGGAELYTERVAQRLLELGHDVTLFAAAVEGRPESEVVEGVRILRRGGRFTVYREARRFWVEHGGENFDVVVDECNTRPFLTPRFVHDVPVVALIHQVAKEVWSYEMPLPVAAVGRYMLEPWWLRTYRSTPVMTVSRSSADSLREFGISDITIVPEGSDRSEAPAVERAHVPTVAFLGRLAPNKRPDHAIEAFRLLSRERPDAQLWIMGDGPMRSRLERNLPTGAEVLGFVPWAERQKRLASAHVLIATSVREGWGLNVSEAAQVGTPAIGYDVPGLRDSVPASGGQIVAPDPAALGRALVDFSAGRLTLSPRVSTVPWAEVGDAVETVLQRVADCGLERA